MRLGVLYKGILRFEQKRQNFQGLEKKDFDLLSELTHDYYKFKKWNKFSPGLAYLQ